MIILENVLHGSPCRKSQKFVGDFLKLSYILRIKKKKLEGAPRSFQVFNGLKLAPIQPVGFCF